MAIQFWMIGKTKEKYIQQGIDEYKKRISRYLKVESVVIPDIKNASKLPVNELKKQEGLSILEKLTPQDYLILLDENGKDYSSRGFAKLLEKQLSNSTTNTIFLIGGAFGFDEAVYQRANSKLSLSSMTFSHQLIRLIFWEQLYRAVAINNSLPYHND
ncbi:MAG: 23S rRNA (pseudouridine(1915)-N(3))-methyltransferase RlmH [Chitinophagales bacterium]